jgi:hypothetical protein
LRWPPISVWVELHRRLPPLVASFPVIVFLASLRVRGEWSAGVAVRLAGLRKQGSSRRQNEP